MEEISLVISNPTDSQIPQRIDWNKDDIERAVRSITEQYKGLQYTEDDMKAAKEDRARLNAMKKAISDRRIEIKKLWNAPIDIFEAEVKEITILIDEPIQMIDAQTSEYENRLKEEKKEQLIGYFEGLVSDMEEPVDFSQVFETRYLNKTVSLSKCKDEMKAKVDKIKSDLATLSTIDNEYIEVGKDTYLKTLDMTKAIQEMTRLTELKKKEQEREAEKQRKIEEQKAQEDVVEQQSENTQPTVENSEANAQPQTNLQENIEQSQQANTEVTQATDPFKAEEKKYKSSFTVIGTLAQINGLKEYMKKNNIKFGKVEK